MKAIIFITASYLVLQNGSQVQGFQSPLWNPNARYVPNMNSYYINPPLAFNVPSGSTFKLNLNEYPALQSTGQRYYSQADGVQMGLNQNQGIEIPGSTWKDSNARYVPNVNSNNINRLLGFTVPSGSTYNLKLNKYPVSQNMGQRYYTQAEGVLIGLNRNKGIEIPGSTSKKESLIRLQALPTISKPAANDRNVQDVNANISIDSIDSLESKEGPERVGLDISGVRWSSDKSIGNKIWNLYDEKDKKVAATESSSLESLHNEKNNNIPLNAPIDENRVTSGKMPLKAKCSLADLSQSLAFLINKPDIKEEKENLDKLFKILKMYTSKRGKHNLPFGDVVDHVEKDLLEPKKTSVPPPGYPEKQYSWQMFMYEYNHGEIRKLLRDFQAGRETNEDIVMQKLKNIFLRLKLHFQQAWISKETINAVLREGLQKTLRDLLPFFIEQCKKNTYANVLRALEDALKIKS